MWCGTGALTYYFSFSSGIDDNIGHKWEKCCYLHNHSYCHVIWGLVQPKVCVCGDVFGGDVVRSFALTATSLNFITNWSAIHLPD